MSFSKELVSFTGQADTVEQEYLYWYDRPVLFPMITERGQELCILITSTERPNPQDIYASAVISKEDLEAISESKMEIRSAFEGTERDTRVFIWDPERDGKILFQDFSGPLEERYLSEKGTYLDINVTKDPTP